MAKAKTAPVAPGSNWAALQHKIASSKTDGPSRSVSTTNGSSRKMSITPDPSSNRQKKKAMIRSLGGYKAMTEKLGESSSSPITAGAGSGADVDVPVPSTKEAVTLLAVPEDCTDRRLVEELRSMVAGKSVLSDGKRMPGTYIALDCEMVGLGPLGSESCLARISVVNYHGHILLDTFVQPRETVTDWRTWISGIRSSDVIGAPQFDEVQKQVSELCEGRIVVGHALENDMKALLLSHPGPMTRDTQTCKALRERAKTKRPGLKKLTEMELGIRIQSGAHSSVTDARATMALYRLHKTLWEQQLRPTTEAYREKMGLPSMTSNGKLKGKDREKSTSGQDPTDASGQASGSGKRKRPNTGEEEDSEGPLPRYEDEGGLLHAAESEDKWKQKKANAKKRKAAEEAEGGGGGGGGGGMKGISSGVTEVITYKDGTKEIRGRKGAVISRSGGGGGGGNWWEEDAS